MIVTIAGRPGSGKSTVAKALATRLGLDHFSSGDFMPQMAAERAMTVLKLSQVAERDEAVDREIDARTARLAEERSGFVMDSRLAWHFIPRSYKVFLDVDSATAAARIYGDDRTGEHENTDLQATARNIEVRAASEAKRYRDYYGVDYLDPANYDLVVDTSDKSVDDVVAAIVEQLR